MHLLFGVLFGFILSRVGATDFDAIAGMFLLSDLRLAGVIGVAVLVAAPALWWLRRRRIAGPSGCRHTLEPKPMKPGLVTGSLLFGAGWAITGTCPGTALAQLGEGRMLALFTLAGILGGAALYRAVGPRLERRLRPQPATAPAPQHGVITVEEVSDALEKGGDVALLDVRERHELVGELGHIARVRAIPLAELPRRLGDLADLEGRTVVTVCRSGARSATAAAVLVRAGFGDVRSLEGGMRRWNELGLAVVREIEAS